ncbi:MAG: glycosyltransferase family 4 protein [Candidatus Omnitrophica bacterium]|nr:glycosyltransferase family 4 protein [Candidatus Omnitrophota bacterium]
MNILYLHNTSEISGGERSLLALWENLDRARSQCFLAVPSDGALTEKARALGVECVVWAAPALRPWNAAGILAAKRALERLVTEKGISLIHSYSPRNNILAALAGRQAGTPVIWHERNLVYGREWDISAMLAGLPDAIICNSKAVARRFERGGQIPSRVEVVYNGVNTEHFRPADAGEARQRLGLPAAGKLVGVVSNLNRRKKVEAFLKAASLLVRKDPSVSLVVVGGAFGADQGDRLRELKETAARLGLADRVVFAGFQDDVRPWLAAMDVYCAVTRREACSRALLEAMAMGKPCVALRDGGNPELVADGVAGILTEPGDEAALSRALEQLLDPAGPGHAYGQAARVCVEQSFTVQAQAAKTQDVYSRLTGRMKI